MKRLLAKHLLRLWIAFLCLAAGQLLLGAALVLHLLGKSCG